jgi:hypothetical protein
MREEMDCGTARWEGGRGWVTARHSATQRERERGRKKIRTRRGGGIDLPPLHGIPMARLGLRLIPSE